MHPELLASECACWAPHVMNLLIDFTAFIKPRGWLEACFSEWPFINNNNNNNRRFVTLAEHTSDHGRQTNSSTEEKGEQV